MDTAEALRALVDEMQVRAILDEYCLRLEIDDFEAWLDLFTPDTEYEVFRRTLRGHDEVRAMLSQAPHGLHIGGAARVTIAGDTAETVQNYLFIAAQDGDWNMGWYHRTLVRTEARWKISRTMVKMQKIGVGTPRLLSRPKPA